jgi:predicted Zn finger-like uncharacterized protein
MPIVIECPQCQRKLRVPDQLLGRTVKCPACKNQFTASAKRETAGGKSPPKVETDPNLQLELDEEPAPHPSSKGERLEEIGKRPSKAGKARPKKTGDDEIDCPHCGASIRASSIRCKYCGAAPHEEEEEESRPSRRERDEGKPHRGGMVLSLGIVSVASAVLGIPAEFGAGIASFCACCCLPFGAVGLVALVAASILIIVGLSCGITAMVMGWGDMHKMRDGIVDSGGRGKTLAGSICGIVGVVLSVVLAIVTIVLIAIYGMGIFAISTAPSPSGTPGRFTPPTRRFSVNADLLRLQEYMRSLK